jgi:hypothetical protein
MSATTIDGSIDDFSDFQPIEELFSQDSDTVDHYVFYLSAGSILYMDEDYDSWF